MEEGLGREGDSKKRVGEVKPWENVGKEEHLRGGLGEHRGE